MPTYHDYVWIQQYLNTSLSLGYCAALIPRSTPAQVLSALGADENTQSEAIGIAELGEVMSDLTEQPETAGAGQVVAVAAVGDDSTLLMQINGGSFAISEELMRPLLSDREVASHYLSVNADSQFIWWSNGTRVAEFELFGSSPVVGDDRMVDLILDVGGIGIDDDAQGYAGEHALEGAFALAEQITGVAVPASLFVEGQFMVAVVPKSGQSPSADVPSEASPRKSPAAWSEVARRYKAAERIPLHGVMFRGRPPRRSSLRATRILVQAAHLHPSRRRAGSAVSAEPTEADVVPHRRGPRTTKRRIQSRHPYRTTSPDTQNLAVHTFRRPTPTRHDRAGSRGRRAESVGIRDATGLGRP